MTTIEELSKAVFSVGSAPRLYSEDPRLAEESVEGWQLSRALQERLRKDGSIIELIVAGYLPESNDVSAGS
jgi:hypothetical protein